MHGFKSGTRCGESVNVLYSVFLLCLLLGIPSLDLLGLIFFCIWDVFHLHINVTTIYTSQPVLFSGPLGGEISLP